MSVESTLAELVSIDSRSSVSNLGLINHVLPRIEAAGLCARLFPYADEHGVKKFNLVAVHPHSLADGGEVELAIVGHTDSTGSAALNANLSAQRAAAVRSALVADNVDRSRIQTRGVGPASPVASNGTLQIFLGLPGGGFDTTPTPIAVGNGPVRAFISHIRRQNRFARREWKACCVRRSEGARTSLYENADNAVRRRCRSCSPWGSPNRSHCGCSA